MCKILVLSYKKKKIHFTFSLLCSARKYEFNYYLMHVGTYSVALQPFEIQMNLFATLQFGLLYWNNKGWKRLFLIVSHIALNLCKEQRGKSI